MEKKALKKIIKHRKGKKCSKFLSMDLRPIIWLSFSNGIKAQLIKGLPSFSCCFCCFSKDCLHNHLPYIGLNPLFLYRISHPEDAKRDVYFYLCAHLPPVCGWHFQAAPHWEVPLPRVPKFSPTLIDPFPCQIRNPLGHVPIIVTVWSLCL